MQMNFIDFLKDRLIKELPGKVAHKEMAIYIDDDKYRKFKPDAVTKPSAVLLLLFLHDEELNIILTLRSKNISHSGQISFPGGRKELGETSEMAALREVEEEIGIKSEFITVLGKLSKLNVPVSNSIITPLVGYMTELPNINVNKDEVEEVFHVPISLLHKNNRKIEKWNFNGEEVSVPLWNIHRTTPLWGASAMIVNELLFLYEEFRK